MISYNRVITKVGISDLYVACLVQRLGHPTCSVIVC